MRIPPPNRFCWLALALASLFLAPDAGAASDYAVVVSAQTASDAGWRAVVTTLVRKHHGTVITFTRSVDEALPALQRQFPRYACFVAQPEEVTPQFVAAIHRLTRKLDDDPFPDCFWGILTGYGSSNALAIARQSAPLTIHKVAGATALAMDMVEEGVTFDELVKNKSVRKEKGGLATETKCPDDTTESLVNELNHGRPDFLIHWWTCSVKSPRRKHRRGSGISLGQRLFDW